MKSGDLPQTSENRPIAQIVGQRSIVVDIRITKTRKSIADAFLALRARKPIEKITVKELCEKAQINKSTFYTHYRDIYDLSEELEARLADEITASLTCPEDLLAHPDRFVQEFARAYRARQPRIGVLFSGSRAPMLLPRIESSLQQMFFEQRPDCRDDVAARAVFTLMIYGSFHAFEKHRAQGEDAVLAALAQADRELVRLLG